MTNNERLYWKNRDPEMCDNEKCVRGAGSCEAEQWAKSKAESEE